MTLQQLEYVVALDNYRHFVTAAEKCFVTQPTLTMQVKKLEEEIGTILFNRKKHPLEPTASGVQFILKARQVLREMQQLKEMVSDERESIAGEFRIGVIPTVAPYLIPRFAGEFLHRYPDTRLNIEEMKSESIIEALKSNKIDLGILVTPLDENELREIPMYQEPFMAYVSEDHQLYGQELIEAKEIEKARGLWLLNQGHCFRNQVLNICEQEEEHTLVYESGSIETIKALIRKQFGFTLVPELSTSVEDPHAIPFTEPQPSREVSIVVHHSFAKEVLVEALRDEILKHLPGHFRKTEQYIRVKWR